MFILFILKDKNQEEVEEFQEVKLHRGAALHL